VIQGGTAALLAVIGGLVGARVYYLLHHYDYVRENTELMFKCGAGIASWGAYIGGLLVFVTYLFFKKMNVMKYLDTLTSVLGLGPFFIRWACFLNGCCYGTLTNLPWGVQYPQTSFAYRSQVATGLISTADKLSLSVHPVQLYLSFFGLILFVVTSVFWRKYHNHRGTAFLFYWILYGVFRFFFEFMRGDVPRYTNIQLTLSQLVILMMVAFAGIGGWILIKTRNKKTASDL
jgi:phosphatidylglycerol:prolipoprotein diacylglycerol transferase